MNHLTWPIDCKENIQWVGQGKGPLAAKSSAGIEQIFKVDHVNQIHRNTKFIDTKQVKLCQACQNNHETTCYLFP